MHTPLLDRWFGRDRMGVSDIPEDKQTEASELHSVSGIPTLITISKEEAKVLLEENVNERLFDILYYQIGHYQRCRHGCSVDFLDLLHSQVVQYCVWFRRLIDSLLSGNSTVASTKVINAFRVALAHKSYCTSSACSLCQHAGEYAKVRESWHLNSSRNCNSSQPNRFA